MSAPSTAILMTLAGIAYGDPTCIADYLRTDALTQGEWSVAWLAAPPDPPVNFAYLARSASTGEAVLAIRGTYPNPFSPAYWADGHQDSPFGTMADWPGAPGAKISAGTAIGFANLLALTDAAGLTLEAAVGALPAGVALTVIGHSLGGTLAPVLALHLSERFPDRAIAATTFAGMTPGNAAFADLFGPGTRLEGRVTRVYNRLDTVAYGWDRVFATHDFYQPAPKGGPIVSAMLLATAARLELGGYGYTPIGAPVPLDGAVRPVAIDCELVAYIVETLYQHMPDTYLGLLGAPPLPFSIIMGSIVLPPDHPSARTTVSERLPTVYLS